jgi:predicted transposase
MLILRIFDNIYILRYIVNMKQTMLLKLAPTTEQHQALLETMHVFNQAANYVASVAFAEQLPNKFEVQKLVYGELRTTYKLPAQLAIRCISKVIEAYKRDKRIQPTFRPEGALVYDPRVMSFKGLTHVSLLTLAGRVLVPFRMGGYQEARIDAIKGQADLLYRKGAFYLAATLDVPAPTPDMPEGGTLGVDLGIVNLATDSEGESWSSEQVETLPTPPRGVACVDTARRPIARVKPPLSVKRAALHVTLTSTPPSTSQGLLSSRLLWGLSTAGIIVSAVKGYYKPPLQAWGT